MAHCNDLARILCIPINRLTYAILKHSICLFDSLEHYLPSATTVDYNKYSSVQSLSRPLPRCLTLLHQICPPQVPGVDGGYSEAELEEIEVLINRQCADIEVMSAEWAEQVAQLQEQQEQSKKSQEEFSKKYEKVANDLAMSEGLGQTYGAPRRRAQERLRTEVSE